jgi:hypothetical protein
MTIVDFWREEKEFALRSIQKSIINNRHTSIHRRCAAGKMVPRGNMVAALGRNPFPFSPSLA